MLAAYVTRGVKAGLVAGLVAGLFVALVANPLVGFADGLAQEGALAGDGHAHDHAADGNSEHDGAVSATVTNVVSVLSGVLWGVLLGGVVFGIGFYFLEPAIPGSGSARSYLLGLAGFVTVSGAPWLALPPRPAGVEQALATDTRMMIYGGMMLAGAVVCLLAAAIYNRLRERHGRRIGTIAGLAPFGLLAIPALLAPANQVSSALPGELAAGLVGIVVFGQLLLWLVLAATHDRLRRSNGSERDEEFQAIEPDLAVTAD